MQRNKLLGKKVAIIATDGFEQSELFEPLEALREAGADVHVISPEAGKIRGFHHLEKGKKIRVDRDIEDVKHEDYDALLIPGGMWSPDQLRVNEDVLRFTRGFFTAGKPVGAICHGPWVLINAGLVHGRTLTSWPSIRRDLEHAGAHWVDEEVVVDRGLVTSRGPVDLDAFCEKLIEEIREGRHSAQQEAASHSELAGVLANPNPPTAH
jgi:protease I